MAKKTLDIPPVINGEYEYVALDRLKHHPRNVRQSDLGAIYESIRANGFYGACVVQRSTGFILIGNHRVAAARELGLPAVPVVYVDADDDAALRIMLSDNRTQDLASDNPAALAELLTELAGTQRELAGTGFDGDDLDTLLNDLANPLRPTEAANDPDAEWEGMPACENGDERAFRSLHVHFADEAAVKDFAALIGQDFSDAAKYIWHPRQAMGRPSATPYRSEP